MNPRSRKTLSVSSADYNAEYAATAAGAVACQIPGHRGYHVNAAGQVWCCIPMGRGDRRPNRADEWRPMTYYMYRGHWQVGLSGGSSCGSFYVGRLVAAAMLPPVEGKPLLGLVDVGRQDDHSLPNLVWKSAVDINAGLIAASRAYQRGRRAMTDEQVILGRQMVRAGATMREAADAVGVDRVTMYNVVVGRTYRDLDKIEKPVPRREVKKSPQGRQAAPLPHLAEIARLVRLCGFSVPNAVRQMLGPDLDQDVIKRYYLPVRLANGVLTDKGKVDEVDHEVVRWTGPAGDQAGGDVPAAGIV